MPENPFDRSSRYRQEATNGVYFLPWKGLNYGQTLNGEHLY